MSTISNPNCLGEVYTDKGILREAGRDAVRALVEAGFLISPKSVLEPVVLVSFLGKALNLSATTAESHPQALLQLWVGWMRLAVGGDEGRRLRGFLGLLNWHVQPRGLGCFCGRGRGDGYSGVGRWVGKGSQARVCH